MAVEERIQEANRLACHGWCWRVVRTSNAYVFCDPQQQLDGVSASKSKNQPGTGNQDVSKSSTAPTINTNIPMERALARFAAAIETKNGIESRIG
jgi:hypothetical protein